MVFATVNHYRYLAQQSFGVREPRDYKSKFGGSPEVTALTWNLFCDDAHQYGELHHLLWALMLLKIYAKEAVLAGMAHVCRTTYRFWTWLMIKAVAGGRGHIM